MIGKEKHLSIFIFTQCVNIRPYLRLSCGCLCSGGEKASCSRHWAKACNSWVHSMVASFWMGRWLKICWKSTYTDVDVQMHQLLKIRALSIQKQRLHWPPCTWKGEALQNTKISNHSRRNIMNVACNTHYSPIKKFPTRNLDHNLWGKPAASELHDLPWWLIPSLGEISSDLAKETVCDCQVGTLINTYTPVAGGTSVIFILFKSFK